MDEQEQILKDAFLRLPKILQETITDSDVQDKLRKLASKYELHIDKWDVLENEIMMTLLGISEPEKLAENIATEVGIGIEQAQKIADDVGQIVFSPIQTELRNNVGEPQNIVEKSRKPIDISKFIGASTNPTSYTPKAKAQKQSTDPYQEPVE